MNGLGAAPDAVGEARGILARALRVVVFTGAGVSAESGVPTFRGAGGLWKTFQPEELATPIAFGRDPALVWEWYAWRREMVARCRPNAAHLALARWALARAGVTIVSQNVDDLHERAAREVADSDEARARRAEPIRLHGSLFHDQCTRCVWRGPARGAVDASSVATLPHCPECGGLLRPDVVWFGEMLPAKAVEAAFAAAADAEACLVVGTTGAVYPAAAVVHTAKAAGARVVVVDPGPTEYDELADVRLYGPAGEILPRLLA
ncbi:MAG TPA: NAD-dependent protein deacylase [Gemmatimonadales bacterium]|nr:NAD-dependent protein deacylase [Gemmatimonadales bacterium]